MKKLLLIILLFFAVKVDAFQLQGQVKDRNGEALSDVSVYLSNSTYGTLTDLKGNFVLSLKSGSYVVKFEYIGYTSLEKKVVISNADARLDVVMYEDEQFLNTVTIKGDRKDPAYAIMAKAVERRKQNWDPPSTYSCKVYIKASLENENVSDSADEQIISKKNLNLVESWSTKYFKAPDKVKEVKEAYKDLTKKEAATGQTASVGIRTGPDRDQGNPVEMNKYLFFTYVDQGDFNFYSNNISLKPVAERPFVSPLSSLNTVSYRFKIRY